MVASDEPEGKNTKKCPRCETVEHRGEFSSQGYCRPCSRAYSRERDAKKRGAAPSKPRVTSLQDVVANVDARKAAAAPRETPRAAPCTATHLAVQKIDTAAALTDRLAIACARLMDAIEDGETIHLTATRIGSVLVLRDVQTTLTRDMG